MNWDLFGWLKKNSKIDGDSRLDHRIRKLREEGIVCASCNKRHFGFFDLAFDRPVFWDEPLTSPDIPDDPMNSHFVSEDICVIHGSHYFVRCVLEIPLKEVTNEQFGFGVWSSLSQETFERYILHSHEGLEDGEKPWFGWFSNSLLGYPDTVNLKCNVLPRAGPLRPLINLEPTEHPLSVDQRTGITIDRVFEIYRLYGHDLG